MQIVWLGQGGLMLVSQSHKLLIDPYMTNELKKIDKDLKRRIGIKKKYFKLKPDLILLTNSNPDHTDEKTLVRFIKKRRNKKNRLTILSCEKTYNSLFHNKEYKKANHIMFGAGDEWTFESLHILAIRASTADRSAFGVIVTDLNDGKKYYIASNTLYNEEIINSLPSDIYVSFIPISGTYGCMNRIDAQRFAARLDSTYVVPINYGMFDNINPQDFLCQGRVIPKPFKAIFFDPSNARPPKKKVLDRRFNEKRQKKSKSNIQVQDATPVQDENAATIVIE
ncbi:MAG: MBL fold metallo-hydrolase [Clostridia bacterium]|nr:MBL fold metallo-hydrolase [Clostridia bacterium]